MRSSSGWLMAQRNWLAFAPTSGFLSLYLRAACGIQLTLRLTFGKHAGREWLPCGKLDSRRLRADLHSHVRAASGAPDAARIQNAASAGVILAGFR